MNSNVTSVREGPQGKEAYDTVLKIWRPLTALERMGLEQQLLTERRIAKTHQPNRFVCPECGEDVYAQYSLSGWEQRRIDPRTGDDQELEDSGTDGDITDVEYRCYDCDWSDGADWFNAVKRAPIVHVEEENKQEIQTPTRLTDLFPDPFFTNQT